MQLLFSFAHLSLIQMMVFGSFLLGVYYFTGYNDGSFLKSSINNIQTSIEETSKKINKKHEEINNIKQFEQQVLFQEQIINQLLNFIPSSLTFPQVSALLIQEAKNTGINIVDKKDEPSTNEEDTEYNTLSVRLQFSGSFSQIMLFLSRLTQQKLMLLINNMDMKFNKQTGLMEVNSLIDAYRYNPDWNKKSEEEENKEETK